MIYKFSYTQSRIPAPDVNKLAVIIANARSRNERIMYYCHVRRLYVWINVTPQTYRLMADL
jgi:hypothetical protein